MNKSHSSNAFWSKFIILLKKHETDKFYSVLLEIIYEHENMEICFERLTSTLSS